jgi:hypothetical protein
VTEQHGSGGTAGEPDIDDTLTILIVSPTLFAFGRVVATPGALTALEAAGQSPSTYLVRHGGGDWGELDAHDTKANDEALKHDDRLLSAYVLPTGTKLWIITEWDRSATTLLLPSEY